MDFLISLEDFEIELVSLLRDNLISGVGSDTFSGDPVSLEFLIARYKALLDVSQLPKKQVLLSYLNDTCKPEDPDFDYNPELGAYSCELWAGVFFNSLSRCHIGLPDFDSKLELCYGILGKKTGIYSYIFCAPMTSEILEAFRKTTKQLNYTEIAPNLVRLFD